MRTIAKIVFWGRFRPESFAEFVEHRARRLDLEAKIHEATTERFGMILAGQPELIDAFEMACSLGPLDCLVVEVKRNGGSINDLEFPR